ERLERDRPVAVETRRDGGDRPVDLDLTGVIDAMFWRWGPVGVRRINRRIEGLERVERAGGHHRNALLMRTPETTVAQTACRTQDGFRFRCLRPRGCSKTAA